MNELSPQASALISAAKDADAPTPEERARMKVVVLGAVGVGLVGSSATAIATGTGVTGATGASGVISVKTILGGVLFAGTVAGTWIGTQTMEEPVSSDPADRTIMVTPALPTESIDPVDLPEVGPNLPEPEANSSEFTSEPPSPPKRVAKPQTSIRVRRKIARAQPKPKEVLPVVVRPAQPSLSRLAEESALMIRVRRALQADRFETALALTEKHATEFPEGHLTEERWAARMRALCGLERYEEAESAKTSLRAWAPNSQHLTHVCRPKP